VSSPVPVPEEQPKQRRRVRVALATLRRVGDQRQRFATEYGKATSALERFAAVSRALRAAAARGAHQPDPQAVDRRLDQITDAMTRALAELLEAQQDHATKTIRADQRRIERNERRRGCAGRSRTDPEPPRPEPDTTAGSTA
jgi:hypothetical protein